MADRQEEWVLVPKKPTMEMSRAVREETRFCNPVGIYQKMLAVAPAHLAITHCENCGCDWLDNGLNPIGCPYCSWAAEVEALRAEVERLRDEGASAVRWAPGSAYLSEVLVELFGPDARTGIDVLETRWRKELERAERLAEALAELITWIPSADMYRRLGFDPEAPMRAYEAAKAALAKGASG